MPRSADCPRADGIGAGGTPLALPPVADVAEMRVGTGVMLVATAGTMSGAGGGWTGGGAALVALAAFATGNVTISEPGRNVGTPLGYDACSSAGATAASAGAAGAAGVGASAGAGATGVAGTLD